MSSKHEDSGEMYEVQVLGELDQDWQQWFNGFSIIQANNPEQQPTTKLLGRVTDQSALRGMLCKLWDLNLTLISVRRLAGFNIKEAAND